jgi:RES domain-containing protein
MIVAPLVWPAVYRMHTPRWAVTPLSGAGAAVHGGRASRIGVEALYMALEAQTAISEYQQLSPLMPPGTLVSYRISLSRVADFRRGFDPALWDPLWEEFLGDWRQQWFDERTEPPSWVLADQVREARLAGILFPSQMVAGGTNLVVYPDRLGAEDRLEFFDPGHALPKDQSSWE